MEEWLENLKIMTYCIYYGIYYDVFLSISEFNSTICQKY